MNQSTPFENVNLYTSDQALCEHYRAQAISAAKAHGAKEAIEAEKNLEARKTLGAEKALDIHGSRTPTGLAELEQLGARLGTTEAFELGRLANEFPPSLKTHDRFGHRIDRVDFHPAWHQLMQFLIAEGCHAEPWRNPGPVAQLHRAAKYLMFAQVENGTQCPITMTFAGIPVLAKSAGLAKAYLPKLLSNQYDATSVPIGDKAGALIGMGMTERQGGSDVRRNQSFALADGHDDWGARFRLTGHKWFLSAPMCDGFLMLAQHGASDANQLSCFFVPRILSDGTSNQITIQRLKDKLGNRSNASSEVEFKAAFGWLLGEPGRGITSILEMGNLTRLDCALGSAGLMRIALANAIHHSRQREAFGRTLSEHPLMQQVLADLALESEAATALSLRLASALDGVHAQDPHETALFRIGTPLAKYWICKRAPAFTFEAMEVLGGNGYIEDTPMARIYREAPVNSIWEGSGNVICLDVLRVIGRHPECYEALMMELSHSKGLDRDFDQSLSLLETIMPLAGQDLGQARQISEALAKLWQAALLLQHAPSFVANAWCRSRLGPSNLMNYQCFGTLPPGIEAGLIIDRALVD